MQQIGVVLFAAVSAGHCLPYPLCFRPHWQHTDPQEISSSAERKWSSWKARRHRLLEWAQENDAFEDDYDSEYRYDISPVPPLHSLKAGSNVIYLGTISKTLSPMMRIRYLLVPPELQDVFATAKQLFDRHSPVTEQEASGFDRKRQLYYESHVRRVRRLN
ncbi:hypothetical protein AJ87_11115 [Rhizobium yanglingense]|nr:hypothetical protein AJ87_11115 [Rhizobium yanglingense]